jgi:hypothetical protein
VHSAQTWAICWGHNFFIFDQNWPTKKENEKNQFGRKLEQLN